MSTVWATSGIQQRIPIWLLCLALALLFGSHKSSLGQSCPPGAVSTGVGVTAAALRTNGVPIGVGRLQPGESFLVRMAVVYFPYDPITGNANAAFENGQMLVSLRGGSPIDVTPPGGVPRIGPIDTPGCGTNFSLSVTLTDTVSPADAAAGTIQVSSVYRNGDALLGDSPLVGVVNGSQGLIIRIGTNQFEPGCPDDATAATVGATVTALRTNGQPIGAGFIEVGESFLVQMALFYIPIDPITGGHNAAFTDGEMLLTIGGNTIDVTPPGGVPLIGGDGTVGCNGLNSFRSLAFPYTVTAEDADIGTIQISGVYTNGYARLGGPPVVVGSQAQSVARLGFAVHAASVPVIALSRGVPGIFSDATADDPPQNPSQRPCEASFGPNTKWFTVRAHNNGLATVSARGCSEFGLFPRKVPLTPLAPTNGNCTSLSTNELRYQFLAQRDFYYWLAVTVTNNNRFRIIYGFEPGIEEIELTNEGMQLSSSIAPNLTYSLESTPTLRSISNSWRRLDAEVMRSDQRLYFLDSTAHEDRQRFYRIVPGP